VDCRIRRLAGRLILCTNNKAHLFFNGLSSCPWCPIESSGVLLFIDFTIVGAASTFSIETIWARILAIPNPGPANPPSMLTYISAVEPSKRAKATARRRRYKLGAVILSAIIAFAFVVRSDNGFAYLFFLGYGLPIAYGIFSKIFGDSTKFAQEARNAESRLYSLQFAWKCDASGDEFAAKLDDLRSLTEEYRKLPERRKQKIRELERALYEIQLRRYLEQFDIASADIPHIKEGRKAMLSAYGIDDAADVTRSALEAVPGFAHFLISQLILWRLSLEAGFKFKPDRGLDPADIQRVDHDTAKRRAEIEVLLSNGPTELQGHRQRIIAARGRLHVLLEKALKDVVQAQADERIAV
jgi:DNA-binding helix-hairpin-helix protein with protein kinase domain